MDALIVVVEPGRRSFQTAYQVKKLSEDLNIKRVYIVGNKIMNQTDRLLIRESLKDLPYLGDIGYNEKVAEADKKGVSPYDMDARIKTEVEQILYALEQEMK